VSLQAASRSAIPVLTFATRMDFAMWKNIRIVRVAHRGSCAMASIGLANR
jgi:hypothetical protein